jgi:N-acetylglutamate synthase-like GNAT family acetyltransferase
VFFIRSAGEADFKQVATLLTGALLPVPVLKTLLARPDSEFVVADDGKRVGGMAYAAMDRDEGEVVVLHQIVVDPALKGQGIGRDLFAEIETCFPAAKRMRVEIAAGDENTIRFFNGLGFSEIGWTKSGSEPGSGVETLIFEKELSF